MRGEDAGHLLSVGPRAQRQTRTAVAGAAAAGRHPAHGGKGIRIEWRSHCLGEADRAGNGTERKASKRAGLTYMAANDCAPPLSYSKSLEPTATTRTPRTPWPPRLPCSTRCSATVGARPRTRAISPTRSTSATATPTTTATTASSDAGPRQPRNTGEGVLARISLPIALSQSRIHHDQQEDDRHNSLEHRLAKPGGLVHNAVRCALD